MVGFFENQIKIRSFPSVINEYQVMGSPWGNYNELRKVMELAKNGKMKRSIHKLSIQNTNALSSLKQKLIVGRTVVVLNFNNMKVKKSC